MVINIIIIKITVPCRDIRAYKLVINHYEEKQKVDTTMCTMYMYVYCKGKNLM